MNQALLTAVQMATLKSRVDANVIPALDTLKINIGDMNIRTVSNRLSTGRTVKNYYLNVDGTEFNVSQRFQNSVLGHIGQGNSVFNLFDFGEVMERFRQRVPTKDEVHITLDTDNHEALGVVQEGKPVVDAQEIAKLTLDQGASFRYFSGRILAEHTPTNDFEAQLRMIGGEEHSLKFYHDCPLDGYGNPSFFIGLLRQICKNGAVAMTSAFRKTINLPDPRKLKGGKKEDGPSIIGTIERTFRNFSIGEEASSGLIGRIETAGKTPASVREFRNMMRIFERLLDPSGNGMTDDCERTRLRNVTERLKDRVVNDLDVTSLSVFDDKPASRVPTPFNVYDIINMATEAATHFGVREDTLLHGAVGRLLTESYDLQGLKLPAPESTPFFFLDKQEQLDLVTLN